MVRYRWIETAAIALAHTQVVVLGLRGRLDHRRPAEKMRVEQGVEFGAPLGRRGERGAGGAADVGDAGGTKKVDGGEKGRGLLRRYHESIASQERGKSDEGPRRARQGNRLAHAAISAIAASRRGAI